MFFIFFCISQCFFFFQYDKIATSTRSDDITRIACSDDSEREDEQYDHDDYDGDSISEGNDSEDKDPISLVTMNIKNSNTVIQSDEEKEIINKKPHLITEGSADKLNPAKHINTSEERDGEPESTAVGVLMTLKPQKQDQSLQYFC